MSAVRGWQLTIDWSGGGGLTGPLEDVTNYVNREPITVAWGRPVDKVDLDTPASDGSFGLINRTRTWDRYFSPENAASPIYGKITPGKTAALTKTVRGASTVKSESWADAAAGVSGWAAQFGGSVSRVTTPTEDGDGALRYVPPGAVATVGIITSSYVSIADQPAGSYILAFRVYGSTAWADTTAVIDWYDSSSTYLSSASTGAVALPATTWTTIQSTALVPPATATKALLRLRLGSTPPNTLQITVDNMSLMSTPADDGKTYTLFSGVLDDLSVDSQSAARTFSGKLIDSWNGPTGDSLSTQVYQGVRTGAAIDLVLTAAGWTGGRSLDPGATVIPYWWEEGTEPAAAIAKLVNSEGWPAIAYVEAGTFVFRDRHHRIRSAASNTSQATFSYIFPAGIRDTIDFKVEKDSFEYDHGLKSIYNVATFSVDQRRPTDIIEVWSSEDPISMTASETRTIFAEPSDPVINAITPSTDNGDIQVLSGSFTATIDRTSGHKFIVVITCTGTGTISRLALRGNALPVARTVQASASDPASISRYQAAKWPSESAPEWANVYDAQAIADRTVSIYADNRPRISFTVPAFNDRYSSRILSLRISDRITVRNDVLGVLGDFQVERLEHIVTRLQVHRLRVSCVRADPVQPSNAITFGVAGKGFDQGAFVTPGIDNPSTMFVFDQAGQGFDQGVFAT